MQTIIDCFERQYGNLFGGEVKYEVNVNFDVIEVIESFSIVMLGINQKMGTTKNYLLYAKQLQSLSELFCRFARMEIFALCTEDKVIDSFLAIVRYGKIFQIRK